MQERAQWNALKVTSAELQQLKDDAKDDILRISASRRYHSFCSNGPYLEECFNLFVAKIFLREANFTDGSPNDQADVKGIVKEKSKKHTPVVGADLFGRCSRYEMEYHCKGSKKYRQCSPSNEPSTIRTNTVYGHTD